MSQLWVPASESGSILVLLFQVSNKNTAHWTDEALAPCKTVKNRFGQSNVWEDVCVSCSLQVCVVHNNTINNDSLSSEFDKVKQENSSFKYKFLNSNSCDIKKNHDSYEICFVTRGITLIITYLHVQNNQCSYWPLKLQWLIGAAEFWNELFSHC